MSPQSIHEKLQSAQETIRLLEEELASTNTGVIALTLEWEAAVKTRTAQLPAPREHGPAAPRGEGTVADVTERRLAEERMRQLNGELAAQAAATAAANQELEAFSYSVSHDLRAPLRAISGFTRILQEEYGSRLDGEGRRLLEVVTTNATRMNQLIEDLLRFSRLGRQELTLIPVNMTVLARSIFAELRAQEPRRNVQFDLPPLPPATGDVTLLRQVFQHLFANALKFTARRDPAVIRVTGSSVGGMVHYEVRDNGVGFDERYCERLFNMFQRLHRQEEFPGTGVGLAMVHRIITRHGGRVWAHGVVGQGAAFGFSLPPADEPGPAPDAGAGAETSRNKG